MQFSAWEPEFDAHIACTLEASGYPRRLKRDPWMEEVEPFPAPVRATSPPSAAELTALQAKARERILAHARGGVGREHTASALEMNMWLSNADTPRCSYRRMAVRLDDERFPANAAHVRTAIESTLGRLLHQCFVPPGRTAASLPFVTWYTGVPHCSSQPLTLPDSDIVYGEYAAPAADAGVVYSAGTVLVYPRSVVPADPPSCGGECVADTPMFLVFKPCDATLLRGAVPVGRVLCCFTDYAQADVYDSGDAPFDEEMIRCFERHCAQDTTSQQTGQTFIVFIRFAESDMARTGGDVPVRERIRKSVCSCSIA